MRSRQKWITLIASVCLIGMLVLFLVLWNQGAPSIDVSAYMQQEQSDKLAATELVVLSAANADVPGMKLVAERQHLQLYYNDETTEIAVRVKSSGKVWYSNPQGRADDSKATPYERDIMSSQFTISFRDQLATLDMYANYSRSVEQQQFTEESIPDGIRVTYTLGDTSLGIEALPKFISLERFQEKILSKLDEKTSRYVEGRYYPSEQNPQVMERLDEQISKQLVLSKMQAAFTSAGYTAEDLAYDNEQHGVAGGSNADKPQFVLPIEYRLDDLGLIVSVPLNELQESEQFRIGSLDLLPYFGAAGAQESGYMFVPDGTGSLIHLNNGRVQEEQYAQRVYGPDFNDNSRNRTQISEYARMPVYGMKADDHAWLAIIQDGDAIASVRADISGKQSSYNHAYTSFAVRGEDTLELYTGRNQQNIALYSGKRYEGELRVQYVFLEGNAANYSGMARAYQSILVDNNQLTPLNNKSELPLYVDLLGAIDKQDSILGIPYNATYEMTTIAQAEEIRKQLADNEVGRVQMRYLGWFGKGINHRPPDQVELVSELGTAEDLENLKQNLLQSDGMLYPDVAFQHIYRNKGVFTPSSDAARFITREIAERSPYNAPLNRMNSELGSYYLLSPAKLPYFVDQFLGEYKSYAGAGLSLRDLGDLLHADYREKRVIFRDTAKDIVIEQLQSVKNQVSDLMIQGGNAYAWSTANHLVNVPTSTSRFSITDEEVPFYQMVIHGYIEYTGSPFNLDDEQDLNMQLLQVIELGMAPHLFWSAQPSSDLKYTRYDAYYSTYYQDWLEDAVKLYKEAAWVLTPLLSQRMIYHERLQEGVTRMTYENGTSIIVNKNETAVTIDGAFVKAKGYAVIGGQS